MDVTENLLTTGERAWCPVDCCTTLGKRVRAAFDEQGRPVGGRVNVATFVCPNGHGWTVGNEEAARTVLNAVAIGDPRVVGRRRRPLIVVP